MRIDILTLFPEAIAPYLATSIVGRAQEDKLADIHLTNIRDFAQDKHKTVDDAPYGGGAGMVMKIEPIHTALNHVEFIAGPDKPHVIVLSARGKQFTQQKAIELSKLDHIILICGRYEGIDQRVADHLADEEISIGPYVLTGGELPAMVIVDTVVRLLPGVVGDPQSLTEESHSQPRYLEYPQYTRPETYQGWKVPKTLLSGHHAAILKWRREHAGKI